MKKKRNILLLEPNYKNKYPPIGLMKISSYHKMLGDSVTFYKGEMKDFIVNEIYNECLEKISTIDSDTTWYKKEKEIKLFLKTKRRSILTDLTSGNENQPLLNEWFSYYSDYYKKKKYLDNRKWDRVYVTTLFTFYWKKTIETIEYAKLLVRDQKHLMVGGVMASLLTHEIEVETGIKPFKGILDKPGMIDDNDIIIDELPLDYSILYEVDYRYPTGSAYFTFMTKGCTRKCAFCSVPILEPTYKEKVETIDKFLQIKELYGEQQHLLLMDNNVLASPKFDEIIDEIKEMGFYKGATFVEPNQYEIAITNLRSGFNNKGYTRRAFFLLHDLLQRRLKRNKKVAEQFYDILDEHSLLELPEVTEENLIKSHDLISPIFEKYRDKAPKQRYVDFNQGTDARYVTEEFMKKMSEIPIRPLRIAFDYVGMKKKYVEAVRLAAKYGIKELSNYLLYNFKDKPEDLYERMRINIELSEELELHIFSFPMKYIPLFGEDAKHRLYVGKHWNKKFIRAIQSVLNVSKGIVASGRSFFEKAFGKNVEEFYELLYMPETYIVYRSVFEEASLSQIWLQEFRAIKKSEIWEEVKIILEISDFKNAHTLTNNPDILAFLEHYTITRDNVKEQNSEINKIRQRYNNLIKRDRFIELTLTYDFE
ncbi:hypothetical protein [Flagellimonas meridianipacifica]|uniref:Radical SAM superfamily enzyme YgiQ (UPF0313 family) n=1 Tax=Flagellimonas meridianipacifica TaxID=1080225 RepID=A0A2T0M924_9FLAO|nr:hypothetical protein [Allomuricauda pacifica]PRX53975.1 hypothetical protein CLV81_2368 [Allomuricauda pacifica]